MRTDILRVQVGLTAIQFGINMGVLHAKSSLQPQQTIRVDSIKGRKNTDRDDVDNNNDYKDNNNDGGKELTKGDCGYENKSAIMMRIAAARKRGFTDQNKLRNDIEFLISATVRCAGHT